MALLSPFYPSAVSIRMSSGQSNGVKKELYLHDLCFTASLKGPFPTEYWLSDVPSISLWALETGMNVMSSFGRLCCLLLLWFKATPQWKWVQDRLWELSCDWQPVDWDTRWIGIAPRRDSLSGWASGDGLWWNCVAMMAKNPTTSVWKFVS